LTRKRTGENIKSKLLLSRKRTERNTLIKEQDGIVKAYTLFKEGDRKEYLKGYLSIFP
jgi:hypothetical protein